MSKIPWTCLTIYTEFLLEFQFKISKVPSVTHRSTVARTVMCRQDGRGRFPVLLDGHSKCRKTHKENPNLVRILYMVCTLNDIYKQYNKLHEH